MGEALAIVVRFFEGWSIQQHVVKLSMLAKSLSTEELAKELLMSLSTEFSINEHQLVACMHDQCAVNGAQYPFYIQKFLTLDVSHMH